MLIWVLLLSFPSQLPSSLVSQVCLSCGCNFDPCFQSGSWCFMTHVLHVLSSLSLELCLPIGSPSGRLREQPSCVCRMVCNYPQASLGRCSRAPLQVPPSNEHVPLELWEKQDWEHTYHKSKVQIKYKRFTKTLKQKKSTLYVQCLPAASSPTINTHTLPVFNVFPLAFSICLPF